MKHTLLIVPIGTGVGLTTVSKGLIHAIERRGIEASYINPFNEKSLSIEKLEKLLRHGQEEMILEAILTQIEKISTHR